MLYRGVRCPLTLRGCSQCASTHGRTLYPTTAAGWHPHLAPRGQPHGHHSGDARQHQVRPPPRPRVRSCMWCARAPLCATRSHTTPRVHQPLSAPRAWWSTCTQCLLTRSDAAPLPCNRAAAQATGVPELPRCGAPVAHAHQHDARHAGRHLPRVPRGLHALQGHAV